MLGQPVSMLIPRVVGFKLTGAIPAGVTATDVVLTITEHAAQARRRRQVRRVLRRRRRLGAAGQPRHDRQHEPGVRLDRRDVPDRRRHPRLPAPHRPQRRAASPSSRRTPSCRSSGTTPPASPCSASTSSSTCRRSSRRSPARSARRTASCSRRRRPSSRGPAQLRERDDLGRSSTWTKRSTTPSRPPTRRRFTAATTHRATSPRTRTLRRPTAARPSPVSVTTADGASYTLDHGAVAIAAITSCTNTSNPSVMLAAGLLARNAVEKGLKAKPWVKTTARPRVQGRHRLLREGRPDRDLEALGFYTVGYGCTTCIGNSGPLDRRGLRGDQRQRPRRHRGALRQPQLRGPHQPRREDELPRVPAAGDRLRAGRFDELRLRDRRARPGRGRQRRLPEGHLAGRRRGAAGHRLLDRQGDVHHAVRRRLRGRRALEGARRPRPATSSSGTRSPPTCASPRTSTA